LKHIEREFLDRNQDDGKNIYTHFTCATDTNDIANAFENVRDIVLKNNLKWFNKCYFDNQNFENIIKRSLVVQSLKLTKQENYQFFYSWISL